MRKGDLVESVSDRRMYVDNNVSEDGTQQEYRIGQLYFICDTHYLVRHYINDSARELNKMRMYASARIMSIVLSTVYRINKTTYKIHDRHGHRSMTSARQNTSDNGQIKNIRKYLLKRLQHHH